MIHTRCGGCNQPIQQAVKGRPRRYCSDACRKAAQRGREASWEWLEENDPQQAKVATVQDMFDAEHGRHRTPSPASSTVDDVSRTILAAVAVCTELRRHSVAAPAPIALRCEAVASALDAALAEHFGEVLKN